MYVTSVHGCVSTVDGTSTSQSREMGANFSTKNIRMFATMSRVTHGVTRIFRSRVRSDLRVRASRGPIRSPYFAAMSSRTLQCRALLFDLDGVLVDSTANVERHWSVWGRRHGLDPDVLLPI